MDTTFPLGFPLPTAFYLTLYVATLLIHVVFMNYVLAGSTYLFLASPMGQKACHACVWQNVLKEWLPFATGLAITAGVAPLLFVQILYQREFYTSNLLLSHRWMAILPVLIVCFYLLYLLKSRWLAPRGSLLKGLVRTGVFLGFAFIAWSWTENHLLSLNESVWTEMYGRGDLVYWTPLLPSRLAMWFLGAFPTLACALMWQARWTPELPGADAPAAVRRLGLTGVGGLVTAGIAAAVHFSAMPEAMRQGASSWHAGPYVIAAAVGAALQLAGWSQVLIRGRIVAMSRWGITLGCLLTLIGMTVTRESIRLGVVGIEGLQEAHADAARVGGLAVFLTFFLLSASLITWCTVQVRRETTRRSGRETAADPTKSRV